MNLSMPFGYQTRHSLLHDLDVRCKLVCICVVSITLVQAQWQGLGILSLVVFPLALHCGLTPLGIFRRLKYFMVLLLIVFVSRALTTPGKPVLELWGIGVTTEGIMDGAVVSWRFFLVMLLGILFSTTTRPSHVKAAVQWLLAPIPLVPEKRAAVMVSLFLRFLPLMVAQSRQVVLAQQARGGHLQRNPVKRMTCLALPLLRKMIHTADGMAMAMASRCYGEDRTDPPLKPWGSERAVVMATLALSVGIHWI